jgi:hypothetical protein
MKANLEKQKFKQFLQKIKFKSRARIDKINV